MRGSGRLFRVLVALAVIASALASNAKAATNSSYVKFPEDEHQHIDGWDYWWGAANLATKSGNRYTVGIAFDSFNGYGATGHQVFPRQGPYKGLSIMTADGPAEWGHPGEPPGLFVRRISTYVPGASELLKYETLDPADGFKDIGHLERTTLKRPTYRLRIDNAAAKVHPTGKRVTMLVDLTATMHDPPLLLGGTGQWWYGIPQTFGYPSRSFQYMQSAKTLTGKLVLQQPNGSMLRETVIPGRSTLVMVHEYDATPEDLFGGLALAEATQIHPRFATYYSGGMPWDLIFVDLRNGAQLMLAVLAFHDTKNGTLSPAIAPNAPTYRTMATLRLPGGESVPLDKGIHVEHLSYRHIVGLVPTFAVQVKGVWTQDWDYRVAYRGGVVRVPNGKRVHVPSFDLGLVPQIRKSQPAADASGNRLAQRVPFVAAGTYGGCPVRGFGWSELIINWYGKEKKDPWFTGGAVPSVPARCGPSVKPTWKQTGNLSPPADAKTEPNATIEGCGASDTAPKCTYVATVAGGVGGYSSSPGGWTVTITRRGKTFVVRSLGGQESYACGTVRRGDKVITAANPGSSVFAGNPGLCV